MMPLLHTVPSHRLEVPKKFVCEETLPVSFSHQIRQIVNPKYTNMANTLATETLLEPKFVSGEPMHGACSSRKTCQREQMLLN